MPDGGEDPKTVSANSCFLGPQVPQLVGIMARTLSLLSCFPFSSPGQNSALYPNGSFMPHCPSAQMCPPLVLPRHHEKCPFSVHPWCQSVLTICHSPDNTAAVCTLYVSPTPRAREFLKSQDSDWPIWVPRTPNTDPQEPQQLTTEQLSDRESQGLTARELNRAPDPSPQGRALLCHLPVSSL